MSTFVKKLSDCESNRGFFHSRTKLLGKTVILSVNERRIFLQENAQRKLSYNAYVVLYQVVKNISYYSSVGREIPANNARHTSNIR